MVLLKFAQKYVLISSADIVLPRADDHLSESFFHLYIMLSTKTQYVPLPTFCIRNIFVTTV